MHFDQVIGARTFGASWAQARAVYGGVVAGAGLRAGRSLVAPERRLRVVDAVFHGPVLPEVETDVEARVLRAGKGATNVEASVCQAGQLLVRVASVYGAPRASQVNVAPPARALPPRAGDPLVHVPGLMPAFLQHFEMVWGAGAPPYSGSAELHLGGWCRHRGEARGEEALLGLIDAWPAPILSMLEAPAAASTMTWSVHFLAPLADPHPGWCWFEAEVVHAAEGYGTTVGRLYDEAGRLLAWSEQRVAVFG